MVRFTPLIIMMLFCFAPATSPAAEVYIWTDKDGVTHIEDQAPKVSPQEKIKVEKHVYEKEVVAPTLVNPQAETLPPGPPSEGVENAGEKTKERELQRQQAIEKARQAYEEAKASEKGYIRRYKNADNSQARHYWKNKLEDIEEKRRQLEELEKSE